MSFRHSLLFLAFAATLSSAPAVEYFPVEDIKPGLHGKTFTVLQGSEIVPLETEILGVQRDGLGPGFDLIIGKLVDERTKLIEAVHGMSGSPLYIDGKLVGALSRRLTAFEKDGHCGFTPIKDMLDVAARKAPPVPENLSLQKAPPGPMQFADFLQKKPAFSQFLSLPLSISGWQESWRPLFEKLFGKTLSFMPVAAGGSMDSTAAKDFPLQPGSALAAVLVTGDVTIAGTGTLTWREGNRIAAFGHPMLGLGHVAIPMASAEIITVLPSYYMPFKMSNTGKVAGVIEEDRLSAIAGTIGLTPNLATYEITRLHNNQLRKPLRGGLVKDRSLAPALIGALMTRAVMNEQDISEDATVELQGFVRFKNLPDMRLDGVYSGGTETRMQAIYSQLMLLTGLYQVFPRNLELENVSLAVKTWERGDTWNISKIWIPKSLVETGESIPVTITLTNIEGTEKTVTESFTPPAELRDSAFELRASSGDELTRRERGLINLYSNPEPRSVINVLNQFHSRKSIYLEAVAPRSGAAVSGQAISNIPPSILEAIAGGSTQKQEYTPIGEASWSRVEIPTSGVVEGMASARIQLK